MISSLPPCELTTTSFFTPARATDAPSDRAWRCTACAAQHEAWRSVCESCGAFGTLQWRAPGTFGHVLPPETRAELEFANNDKK